MVTLIVLLIKTILQAVKITREENEARRNPKPIAKVEPVDLDKVCANPEPSAP